MINQKKIKRSQETIAAYKAVFDTEKGRIVLVDLMQKCFFSQAVTETNSVLSAFNDGKRCAVLDIFKMIGFDERKLIELLKQSEEDNGK